MNLKKVAEAFAKRYDLTYNFSSDIHRHEILGPNFCIFFFEKNKSKDFYWKNDIVWTAKTDNGITIGPFIFIPEINYVKGIQLVITELHKYEFSSYFDFLYDQILYSTIHSAFDDSNSEAVENCDDFRKILTESSSAHMEVGQMKPQRQVNLVATDAELVQGEYNDRLYIRVSYRKTN